jgi:hypothetical protein
MANTKQKLFQKRRLRVRNKLKSTANGRARLSVHRSNKNISVQLIDDVNGVTLASASTLEKDLGWRATTSRRGRQGWRRDCRTCQESRRHRGVLLRPWWFPLSREGEGFGRRCP